MSDTENGGRSVKSAERVLDLLEYVGNKPDGAVFSDLARDLNIPKSSLHGLLSVLLSRGYLQFKSGPRSYGLGLRLWETGLSYQRQHSILAVARGHLESVVQKVNETAQLAKLDNTENVYLAKVESTQALRLSSDVGRRLSAHATGVGKALLAQLPDEEVSRRFGTGTLERYTPNTLVTVPDLLAELAATRERGFAVDNEEHTPGVFCLAVPVFEDAGRATAAISVSIPTIRSERGKLSTILSSLCTASLQLSGQLSGQPPEPLQSQLCVPKNSRDAIETLVGSKRRVLGWIPDAGSAASST